MTVGAGLGVVTGVVLAVSQPATGGESLQQIIGFLALVFGVAGVASGALIAVILDRTLGRRARAVTAKRKPHLQRKR